MLTILRQSRVRSIVLFLCACSLVPNLKAQSTEADIKGKLKDRPLYLRGFWREDKLQFDSEGHVIGKPATVTFTICGFDPKKVSLKPDKLVLEGPRVGLELKDNKQKRVPLNNQIHIEIAKNSNGDYGPALDTIFADGLDKLLPSLPSYWKSYGEKNFVPASNTAPLTLSTNSDSQLQDSKPKKIGGSISPPKLLSSAEPVYNSVAKSKQYSGSVLIHLWVEPSGTISHLSIRQALGLGMDEDALAAVQRYTFQPAMQNGKPVLVELNVESNFSFNTSKN